MFVVHIGGFLGSGKTTMLLELAKAANEAGLRVAVIVNEVGEVGIDGTRINAEGYEAVELAEGCICCSLAGTLQNTLITISSDFKPDLIILEPTGLALPHRVQQIIRTSMIRPEKVMTIGVVDAHRFEDLLNKRRNFMERQLMNADLIALNKCDLIGEAVIHRAVDELSQICPGREVFPVSALTGEGMGTIIERLI